MTSNGKVFLIIFLSSLASITVATNWWETGISKTITLANFDEFVGGDKHVVVEIFAQWCHYCRLAQPEWDKLAEHYLGDNQNRKDIIVAKVDAGIEPVVADRFGVTAYPAYVLFKKNDIYPTSRYGNERTAEKWISWVEGLVGPEEIPVPKDEIDDSVPILDQILQDIDLDALGDVQVDKIERKENKDENMDNMDIIVSKIDFLVDLVNGQDGGAAFDQRGRDMKELTSLIRDIDKKVTIKSSGANDDINFGHGISFLLLGVFLGIGISFGIINYQKLARSRKLLD